MSEILGEVPMRIRRRPESDFTGGARSFSKEIDEVRAFSCRLTSIKSSVQKKLSNTILENSTHSIGSEIERVQGEMEGLANSLRSLEKLSKEGV